MSNGRSRKRRCHLSIAQSFNIALKKHAHVNRNIQFTWIDWGLSAAAARSTQTVPALKPSKLTGSAFCVFLLRVLFLCVTVCCGLVDGWNCEIIVTTGWSTRKMQLAQSAVHTLHSQTVTHIYTHTYSVTCTTTSINILKKRETHTVSKKYPEGISHEGKHRMIQTLCVWDSQHFHKAEKVFGTFTLEHGCA